MIKSIFRSWKLMNLFLLQHGTASRAHRNKRLAKAIERQAWKLRAKGNSVDFEALKADCSAQHRGQNFNSSDSDDNDENSIDVVGVADDIDCKTQDYRIQRHESFASCTKLFLNLIPTLIRCYIKIRESYWFDTSYWNLLRIKSLYMSRYVLIHFIVYQNISFHPN